MLIFQFLYDSFYCSNSSAWPFGIPKMKSLTLKLLWIVVEDLIPINQRLSRVVFTQINYPPPPGAITWTQGFAHYSQSIYHWPHLKKIEEKRKEKLSTLFLFMFMFVFLSVCVCVCVCGGACKYPWKPKRVFHSQELESQANTNYTVPMLGPQFRSCGEAAWLLTTPPYLQILHFLFKV